TAALALEEFVPGAQKFVEEHRGLKFKGPVKVTALSAPAFRERFLSVRNTETDTAEMEKTSKVLEALGLVPHGTDVAKAMESLSGDAAVGFYDTKTKDLVVRGTELTPFVRETIVHELTHA